MNRVGRPWKGIFIEEGKKSRPFLRCHPCSQVAGRLIVFVVKTVRGGHLFENKANSLARLSVTKVHCSNPVEKLE